MSDNNHNHAVTIKVESVKLDLDDLESSCFRLARYEFVKALKNEFVRLLNTIETDECDTHKICSQFGLISLTDLTSDEIIENIDELIDPNNMSGMIDFGDENILSFTDDHFTIT